MAYTFRTSDLPKLDLDTDRGTDFTAWQKQWLAYGSLSGLSGESAAKQVQALQLCFSRETLNIVENLGLTETERQDQARIIAALKQHVDGRINETIERRNLRRRIQQIGESVDDYLVSLRELAKTCNFCNNDCLHKAIRDQIIKGLSDGEIIQELLQVKDLTLDQAITKCRGLEAAKKSRSEIQGTPDLNAARTPQPPFKTTCTGCGSQTHDGGRKNCPAYGQPCHNCGKVGHFSRICRQRPSTARGKQKTTASGSRVNTLSTNTGLPSVQLSRVTKSPITPAPTVKMLVTTCNGQAHLEILPDSGADVCAAGPSFVQALGEHMDNLINSDITPRAVNGSILHPLRKIPNVSFQVDGKTTHEDVHIYESVNGALISWNAAQKLSILPECYPSHVVRANAMHINVAGTPSIPTSDQLMSEFPSVFNGQICTMPGEKFKISLMSDTRPFCVTAPRTVPFAYREKLKEELDLLVSQNIITPVTEPTEWCAPIVVAPKKDSDRIRMCVDLSKLNRFVRREHYPSVTPAEAVADIAQAKAKRFTVFDALKGYHQVPLDEESQALTTFITPFGRFKYLRAPYGICSISDHYNRRMDGAFAGMQDFCRVVDDVILFDGTPEQHIQHLREALRRCEQQKISLNREKFKFCLTEVQFAGFTLTSEGYSVNKSIVKAIGDFPTPSSRTDLRSFCGLVNQLASSTRDVATALAPLRPLLSSHNDFLWTEVHGEAFQSAKQLLTSAPTLAYFDATKETRLHTDASTLGLGRGVTRIFGPRRQ